jgi:Protein of unknown function (DUF1501)/Secretion system C-terminal sorting domain
MGGFDTHGGQVQAGNTATGNHANLLKNVSDAVSAFQADITQLGLGKRVIGMTFSEFGRRIISNGSYGTDHGSAQPVFLFGEPIKQGVLGDPPDLSSSLTVESSLPMQYDFRSVYATVLRDWFCVAPADVSNILYKNYQYLPLVEASACTIEQPPTTLGDKLITNAPNPFINSTTITFKTDGGYTLIQVFDVSGRLVGVPVSATYTQGEYNVVFNGSNLAAGVYYARLQNGSTQQVRTMIKVAH